MVACKLTCSLQLGEGASRRPVQRLLRLNYNDTPEGAALFVVVVASELPFSCP
jgi:hypothetical protein